MFATLSLIVIQSYNKFTSQLVKKEKTIDNNNNNCTEIETAADTFGPKLLALITELFMSSELSLFVKHAVL